MRNHLLPLAYIASLSWRAGDAISHTEFGASTLEVSRTTASEGAWRTFRRTLQTVHLWLGLALCIPIVVIGVSGSALLVQSDYVSRSFPSATAAGPKQPIMRAIEVALAAGPRTSRLGRVDLALSDGKPGHGANCSPRAAACDP
jgi:hypothetical protein